MDSHVENCDCKVCVGNRWMDSLAREKGGSRTSEYIDSRNYVHFVCSAGHPFRSKPHDVKYGRWCKQCALDKKRLTADDYLKMQGRVGLKWLGPSSYIPYAKEESLWECSVGHRCNISYNHLQGGRRCPSCAPNRRLNFTSLDKVPVAKWLGFMVDGGFDKGRVPLSQEKTWWECSKGHVWETVHDSVKAGHGCPVCAAQASKAEIAVFEHVRSVAPDAESKNREILGGLEIDVFVPSKRVAFEYCGLHWHGHKVNGEKAPKKHLNKLNACIKAGVKLITIFEDEWLEREPIVRDRISRILDVKGIVVGARKCEVMIVDRALARAFEKMNHLQGTCRGNVSIGLKMGEELLAVGSFSQRSGGEWELVRYTLKTGYSVQGGLGRILAKFEKETLGLTSIVSFADRRWSTGRLYKVCGFSLAKVLKPDYRYFKKKGRKHKFGFRKEKLAKKYGFPMTMTENQMSKEAGWDKIWDCGLEKWVRKVGAVMVSKEEVKRS